MTYFAFLRAINVPGSTKISMTDLRRFMADVGFAESKTLLQTGNVMFEGDGRAPEAMAAFLKEEISARLGVETEFFVRSLSDLQSIVAGNPFSTEAEDDPAHLLVLFASGPTTPEQADNLRGAIKGREYFRAEGKDFYFVYPDGIGESKLTAKIIERHLGVRVTARNWNTLLKLIAMAQ